MDIVAQHRDGLLGNLRGIRSEIEIGTFLDKLAHDFGFACFSIVTIPPANRQNLHTQIVLSSSPPESPESPEAIADHDRDRLLRNSTIFERLRRSTTPRAWCRQMAECEYQNNNDPLISALFQDHSITTGIFFPVHGADGNRAAVGFAGNRAPLTHREEGDLALLVIHAYDRFDSLRNLQAKGRLKAAQGLTSREREVLVWVAHGKTSAEIAAILSLSENTINTYINTAMRKLDCVNRTQLVAKALRLHLID